MMPVLDNGFIPWQAAALLAMQGAGLVFWWFQNGRPGRLGGGISLVKAHWLVYAIVLWLVVPSLLATRHWAMAVLAASVGLRAVVEVPLCLQRRWRVAYGMIHNVLHLGLCMVAVAALASAETPDGFLLLMVILTALSVLTEMLFVSWFRKATSGPGEGVYFVPGGERFRRVNLATGWIFLPQYAIFITVLVINL